MAIQLMGFPTTLGLPRKAFRHGPEALRTAGLIQKIERLGPAVEDLGDMALVAGNADDPVPQRLQKVVDAARRQADQWLTAHRPGDLMLTVGGDHSTSLGTIWALTLMGHDFDLVWIDAHGDFNVPDTSPTGNPHGMVLALACGLLPQFIPKLISPGSLHLWGIRDLDPGERAMLEREHVEVLDPAQARQDHAQLVRRLKPNVMLSFDIDSVEPAEAPGTMTPVPGGFHTSEALELAAQIARHRNLLAVDIVEFHPDIDRESLTVDLALTLAQSVIQYQVAFKGTTV